MRLPLILAVLAAPAAAPALAATEEEWEAFRAEVERACTALILVDGELAVEVNPFGSESYGVAILTVAGPNGTDRLACVYDKATGRAEVTAAFAPEG